MGILWKALEKACQTNNVQLFATTHDLDSIKGIAGHLDNNSVAAFHLEKMDDDELKAFFFSRDDLEYMLHQSIEMRSPWFTFLSSLKTNFCPNKYFLTPTSKRFDLI
jgi:AAA15 family ATPase/GTPase